MRKKRKVKEIDWKVVGKLIRNKMSMKDIAKKINIPLSTLYRRFNKIVWRG